MHTRTDKSGKERDHQFGPSRTAPWRKIARALCPPGMEGGTFRRTDRQRLCTVRASAKLGGNGREAMKIVLALCLILSSSAAFAAQPARAPASAAPACDRECLRGKITEVLYALVEHDVSKLAVAPTLARHRGRRREAPRQSRPRAFGDQAARLSPGHPRRARGPGRRGARWSRNRARRSCSWCGSRSTPSRGSASSSWWRRAAARTA